MHLNASTAVRLKFEITVKSVSGLGTSAFQAKFEWKKSKGSHGETMVSFVEKGNAIWNETITFEAQLYKEKGVLAKKSFVLCLKEEKKKDKKIGTLTMNLADYVKLPETCTKSSVELPLTTGNKKRQFPSQVRHCGYYDKTKI